MGPGRGKEPGEAGFDPRTIPVRLGSEPVRRIRASAELATLSFGPATYPSTGMLMQRRITAIAQAADRTR
jgi:hypothetical protein